MISADQPNSRLALLLSLCCFAIPVLDVGVGLPKLSEGLIDVVTALFLVARLCWSRYLEFGLSCRLLVSPFLAWVGVMVYTFPYVWLDEHIPKDQMWFVAPFLEVPGLLASLVVAFAVPALLLFFLRRRFTLVALAASGVVAIFNLTFRKEILISDLVQSAFLLFVVSLVLIAIRFTNKTEEQVALECARKHLQRS